MPDACEDLIDQLTWARKQRGLDKKQMADTQALTQSIFARIVTKKSLPTVAAFCRIASAAGASVLWGTTRKERSSVKKVDRYFYPAVFTYEPEREIAVVFPDLDVATSGKSDANAMLSARELLGCVMFGLEEDGVAIPAPTPLSKIETDENEKAVLIDVYMPSVRMAQVNRSVKRTVTLPAWLNAAAQERNIDLSQVLQDTLKQQLHLPG